jgi:hypothetical protein
MNLKCVFGCAQLRAAEKTEDQTPTKKSSSVIQRNEIHLMTLDKNAQNQNA